MSIYARSRITKRDTPWWLGSSASKWEPSPLALSVDESAGGCDIATDQETLPEIERLAICLAGVARRREYSNCEKTNGNAWISDLAKAHEIIGTVCGRNSSSARASKGRFAGCCVYGDRSTTAFSSDDKQQSRDRRSRSASRGNCKRPASQQSIPTPCQSMLERAVCMSIAVIGYASQSKAASANDCRETTCASSMHALNFARRRAGRPSNSASVKVNGGPRCEVPIRRSTSGAWLRIAENCGIGRASMSATIVRASIIARRFSSSAGRYPGLKH